MKTQDARYACDRCGDDAGAPGDRNHLTLWRGGRGPEDFCDSCWRALIALLNAFCESVEGEDFQVGVRVGHEVAIARVRDVLAELEPELPRELEPGGSREVALTPERFRDEGATDE